MPLISISPWSTLGVCVLAALVFFSALGMIYSKHCARQLFSQLQQLQTEQDQYHIEWGQLLLEQGAWASDARVERVAKEHLKMRIPNIDSDRVFQQ